MLRGKCAACVAYGRNSVDVLVEFEAVERSRLTSSIQPYNYSAYITKIIERLSKMAAVSQSVSHDHEAVLLGEGG